MNDKYKDFLFSENNINNKTIKNQNKILSWYNFIEKLKLIIRNIVLIKEPNEEK